MDKIAGAQGFSNSLELENMLVDLEGWLDARYPIPAENVGANLPHGVRVMTVALCMCSEASLREQNIAGGLGQRAKSFENSSLKSLKLLIK